MNRLLNNIDIGELTIEVSILKPERVINSLWTNGISVKSINKIDLTTIRFNIQCSDYIRIKNIVENLNGKISIVGRSKRLLILSRIRSSISLVGGITIFLGVIYILSNYIWAIEIKTKSNLSPFEVRQQLYSIGIKPGIKKGDINVYEIERKMENLNSQIMWIRTRIEGSTLKVIIEEKINPPSTEIEKPNGVVAKMDGEVKSIYTYSGNPAVSSGDIVKEGDTLILPIEGREGFERDVKPSGYVIANTFYQKFMEIQISGEKLERTGKIDREVYLDFWGRKIYLKKFIDRFKYYDKIEGKKGFFNTTAYFEKNSKNVEIDKDKAVEKACEDLEKSLSKTLSNSAKIIDKKVNIENIEEGKILVSVVFTVEQNIAKNLS